MSDTDKAPDPTETPDENPAFVSKEDFDKAQEANAKLLSDMQNANSQLMTTVNTVLANQQQTPAPEAPKAPPMDIDGLNEQISQGGGGEQIAKMVNQAVETKLQNFQTTVVDPMRQSGADSISSLAIQQAKGNLTHFKDYEEEIMENLNKLQPEQRANPKMVEAAHNYVVGAHMDEILEKQKEEILRQGQEDGTITVNENSGRNNDKDTQGPKPEDVLDQTALDHLAEKGVTPEQFAIQQGFKDWDEYADMALNKGVKKNAS